MNRTFLSLSAAVSLLASFGCSTPKPASPLSPERVSNVEVSRASVTTIPDALVAVGTIRAAESAQISAQIMGNVVAVNVHEGDVVRRGQVLVAIDSTQAQAALERAQAALVASRHEVAIAQSQKTLADSTLKRFDTLFQRKSVSPQEFDEVKARAEAADAAVEAAQAAQAQAKATVAQAQSAFSYCKLRSPVDGLVTARRVDPGTLASPGMPLLIVEATGRLRLETTVDEKDLRIVRTGEAVPVTLDAYSDQKMSGRVIQILPAADPASRTFVVKIELPASAALRSGLFGRAQFSRGQRNALVIPRTAVIERGSTRGVFVVAEDKIASLRYITLGEPVGDGVEVLSGLTPREAIVLSPGDRELGGKRIEVQ